MKQRKEEKKKIAQIFTAITLNAAVNPMHIYIESRAFSAEINGRKKKTHNDSAITAE